MSRTSIVLALCASLGTVSTAFAVDPAATDLQAQLNWRATFGGASRHHETGYGLTVGYRAALDAPAAQILQLDISDRAALARVLGLPLLERSYQLDQNETGTITTETTTTVEQPWYSESWVWWTVGGVVLAAGLGGKSAGDAGTDSTCNNCSTNSNEGSGVLTVNGGGGDNGPQACVAKGMDPVPESCQTVPHVPGTTLIGHAAGFWLQPLSFESNEGTGGMGDLVAR